ncbi:MAG: diacylglycerol/lipid kinase family protein [Candidatus Kariarchaeaceae archaeon]
MADKIKLIFNPASRGGKSKSKAMLVHERLKEMGVDHEFYETERPIHGIELAENAKDEGFNVVCSIGGDGTAHEVANGAIRGGLTFSLIPAGSGNDFSKGIGLTGDLDQAIETLVEGKNEETSIIKMGERYSINIADVGLGARAVLYSLNSLKWMHGSLKYTLLTMRTLMRHKAYPTRIVIDGEESEYNINILAAGYGQTFGSGMRVLPDARYNDEELTIGIVKDASKYRVLRIFPRVFSGTHVEVTKYVSILRGKKVEIYPNSDRPLYAEAEGEPLGEAPITFEGIPRGMKVRVPKDWDIGNQSLFVD